MKKSQLIFFVFVGMMMNVSIAQNYTLHFESDHHLQEQDLDSIFSLELTRLSSLEEITITGHTDDIGSQGYNQVLSEKRAKTFESYFIKKGVNKAGINVNGKGETSPLVTNNSEFNRAKNRRVEVIFFYLKVENTIPDVIPLEKPRLGCRAFFSGGLVAGYFKTGWHSEAFKEDAASEYVGAGAYPKNAISMPKAVKMTFDGIAIGDSTRVVIYSKPDFKGEVVLDVCGPLLINNILYKESMESINVRTLKNPELDRLFPPSKRIWSSSNMNHWDNGSMKILCGCE
jgi:hypothetical protein